MLAARKTIEKLFGKNYALESPRFYKTKSKGAQEAHEAIRPTNPEKTPDELNGSLDANQHKLYTADLAPNDRLARCNRPFSIR